VVDILDDFEAEDLAPSSSVAGNDFFSPDGTAHVQRLLRLLDNILPTWFQPTQVIFFFLGRK
jgi:hypothetical protein